MSELTLVPFNMFKPPIMFYWPFQGDASYMDHSFYLCFMFVFVLFSCLFLAYCAHWLEKCLPLVCYIFLSLSHMVSRVRCGTRLYINSWSLPPLWWSNSWSLPPLWWWKHNINALRVEQKMDVGRNSSFRPTSIFGSTLKASILRRVT